MTDLCADHFLFFKKLIALQILLGSEKTQITPASCGDIALNSAGCIYIMMWKNAL